ncbi:MAG: hypothetical protein JXA72_12000 [Bacteroidales bacterium]|nr:hypothetical protein [Bacteroidales bacterium]
MVKKVLVVYYTQTGQLGEIVNSICTPLKAAGDVEVVFEILRPEKPFPFPWTSDQFFQTMPESVKGIPCELEPLTLKGDEHFDLIIAAWQPWYLSPSIPTHALFQHETIRKLMNGKPVITVIGSRNMWVMAQEVVKDYINSSNAKLVGNIILRDKAPNLLGVISIIRWMFQGKKDRYMKIVPPAGISDTDIQAAAAYGPIILEALKQGNYDRLQEKLVAQGAVDVMPEVVMIEKRGIVFFRLWAAFILRKGPFGSESRVVRVRMFKYYLLAVLYLVSPFASLLYEIIRPFRRKTIKKQISLYQSV